MTAEKWANFRLWFARATAPDYKEWEETVRRIGGCAHPIHLTGTVRLIDSATGHVVHELSDGGGARLIVPCGNRRRHWCAPCSRVYQWDTWHLVKAGLVGGKGVPESVASHPRAFVTLTAPSFGTVHTPCSEKACHPRRGAGFCDHGEPLACWARHSADEAVIGQPLCPGCYDYPGAVLWNAHAGQLWHRFTDLMRRQELPRVTGLTRSEFARSVRVSFVKVAEFQRRGLVHFHAVVRLDPLAEGEALPPRADQDAIATAALRAAALVRLVTSHSLAGQWELGFGAQVDVQPIPMNGSGESAKGTGADKVASYVAKYVTKGAESTGTVDRPLYCKACRGTGFAGACRRCGGSGLRESVEGLRVLPHARALIGAAVRLGELPEYRGLHLRRWAHQFGYGGHFSTKSRSYSTTMTALRATRTKFRSQQTGARLGVTGELITDSELTFFRAGYASATEEKIAEGIRDEIEENRIEARAALAELKAAEEEWM